MAAAAAARVRESVWPGGRVPLVLTIPVVDSGKIMRFSVPPHLMAQKRAMDRARGRRRR